MSDQEDKGAILAEALAEYYDVDPETISGYVIACERDDEKLGATLSTAWSINKPFWQLLGMIDEVRHQVERNNRQHAPSAAKPQDRQPTRGRRGRR